MLLIMGVGVPTPQLALLRMEMETTPPGLHSPLEGHIWVTYKMVLLQLCHMTPTGNARRVSLEMGTNSI